MNLCARKHSACVSVGNLTWYMIQLMEKNIWAAARQKQRYDVRPGKSLIRLGACPGWSESSLGAQVILSVLSCCSSFMIVNPNNTRDISLTFGELPEMRCKMSSKTCHFSPKFWNLPNMQEKISYIYILYIFNKSPWNEMKPSLMPLWKDELRFCVALCLLKSGISKVNKYKYKYSQTMTRHL